MYMAGAVSLLKLILGCTVAGFSVTVLMDKDVHRLVKWIGVKKLKKVKSFTIGNEHATVIGLTQHGKTYGTIKTLERMKEPILFFNTNQTPVGNGWIEAKGSNSIEQIIYGLKQGYKINFLPDDNLDGMSKQLSAITDGIYKEGRGFSFRFVIDEIHLFKMAGDKKGHTALIRLSTTGLGRGYKCIFISQRGAMVDNTIYTQSTKHIMYALGKADYNYLKGLGFPSEEIEKKVNGQYYAFVEFDQKTVSEVKKIE
jgi:hypothetical protein